MPHILTIARKCIITMVALSLVTATPALAYADGCTPPDASQPGVHVPTGSDASTFVYQCDGVHAGDWTNPYYIYSPSANSRTPLYSPNYNYNCTTGIWTMDSWDYNAPQHQYSLDRVTTPAPAGIANNCPVPAATASTPAQAEAAATTGQPSAVATTGPNSTTTANLNASNAANLTNTTNATVNNGVTAVAASGNAVVSFNTAGGSAATGNANDQANVINLLQSSSNFLGTSTPVKTFTANINGDVNGDLLFDPATLGALQNASGNTNVSNDLTINNTTNANLNNTINLNATSGDAAVTGNTQAGDATTGTAQAVANVMNYINSAVTAGQSFIGTININGNLNGDILLPANLIDQLIASNVPTVTVNIPAPGSTNSDTTTVHNAAKVTNTNNQNIDNTVNSNAQSGAALVSGNTAAGDAVSGQATTNVTAFNLTGSTVIGQNDILVFVNVVGTWYGMIVNAPAGSTAAELGGGITRNTTIDNTATLNNTNNFGIDNNINVAAKSGNAKVSGNTNGGNATTGDARTAVNLLNVQGSSLDLSNWFGVLFINVFGTWHGSFGVNTSAGDPIVARTAPTGTGPTGVTGASGVVPAQVFRFVPRSSATFAAVTGGGNGSVTPSNVGTPQGAVLAAHINRAAGNAAAPTPQLQSTKRSIVQPAVIIGGLVILYILADAVVSRRRA